MYVSGRAPKPVIPPGYTRIGGSSRSPTLVRRTRAVVVRRAPSGLGDAGDLGGLNFDFLKGAANIGQKIIAGGAAVAKGATHLAGEVRKLTGSAASFADKADQAAAAGDSVGAKQFRDAAAAFANKARDVANAGNQAADNIETGGRTVQGATQGAVAGGAYGAAGKLSVTSLAIGAAAVLGLGAFVFGRSSR